MGWLCMVSSRERPPELPSWCPNLDSLEVNAPFAPRNAGTNHHFPRQPSVRPLQNSNLIQVKGIEIDTVEAVSELSWLTWSEELETIEFVDDPFIEWLSSFANVATTVYTDFNLDKPPERFCVTVTGDSFQTDPTDTFDLMEAHTTFMRFLHWKAAHPDLLPEADWPEFQVSVEQVHRYSADLQAACSGRRFFATKKGRIGLAPKDVQVGDSVCVFYGSWYPSVVRQPANQLAGTLIGNAFVYGVMDGEALALTPEDGAVEKMFVLS